MGDAAREPANRFHFLRLAELLFQALALRDISHGAEQAAVGQPARIALDHDDCAVLAQQGAFRHRRASAPHCDDAQGRRVAVRRRIRVRDGQLQELFARVARELAGTRVDVQVAPVRVGDEHRVADVFQDSPMIGLARAQRFLRSLPLDRVPQHARQELPFDATLHQVVLRPGADRLERQLLVVEPRDHDDRLVRRPAPRANERIEPLAVGQAQIEQHDVHAAVRETGERVVEPVHPLEVEGLGLHLPQELEDEPGISRIVLDQQDGDGLHGGREAHGSRTICSQNCSIELTASRNSLVAIGFLT